MVFGQNCIEKIKEFYEKLIKLKEKNKRKYFMNLFEKSVKI